MNAKQLVIVVFLANTVTVTANFILTVKFTHYTNPSGICAECVTRLADLNVIVPSCCGETVNVPTENCEDASCRTRFRWRLREYGASLATRPETSNTDNPAYSFNPCVMIPDICPFEEMSRTFEQGETSFLGRSNPNDLSSSAPWTGNTQFFIESIHERLPNIIDSFLINLDNLQLGADFTEEVTYIGYHNISQMSMSFKVECSPNYYDPNCTTLCEDKPGVFVCSSIGEIVCMNVGGDPSNGCTTCLPLFNTSTNCTTCIQPGYDPEEHCTQCLPNRDPMRNCTSCLPDYSGENCVSDAVVGGVVGGLLVVVMIILIIVVVVVLTVKLGKGRRLKKTAQITAVNSGYYEDVKPKAQLEADVDKTNTTSSNQERDFENPLYESGAVAVPENDYSAPWDSRASRRQPVVISSSSSSHAIAKRVNSNEPRGGSVKKNVELPAVSRGSKCHQYENTKDPESPAVRTPGGNNEATISNSDHQPVYDYAEPLNSLDTAVPIGVEPTTLYDYAESPSASKGIVPIHNYDYAESAGVHSPSNYVAMGSVDTHGPPDVPAPAYDYGESHTIPGSLVLPPKVKAHGDNPPPGFKDGVETVVYTNTTPGFLTMEAEQHYDVGQ